MVNIYGLWPFSYHSQHVPREQRRNIEQNKKASEALLALKKQPRSKIHLVKPSNPPPPPPSSVSRSSTPPPPPPVPAPPPPRSIPEQPSMSHGRGSTRPPPPPRQGSVITTKSTHSQQYSRANYETPDQPLTHGGSKRASRSSIYTNSNGMNTHVSKSATSEIRISPVQLISCQSNKTWMGKL